MFEMGPGSLHATTTHIIATQRFLSDILAQRQTRPRIDQDGAQRTPAELIVLLDEIAAELAILACARPLEETISRTRPDGKTYTYTRGAVFTHVTTHAMHHRAQCLNMLRHIGVKPLPPVSVMEWTHLADAN
jgi:uncharacterized damage-inducible protein DinB